MGEWIKGHHRISITAIVIALLVFILVMLSLRRPELPVTVATVTRQNIANTISTNGKIEPVDDFSVFASAPARVKRILVKEGDHVKAGRLLVELDDAEARAQAARAAADLKAAQANLNAIKTGGTQEEVLATRSDLQKSQAELDSAQRSLAALQKLHQNGAASGGEVQEAQDRVKRAQADVNLLKSKQTGRYSNPEIARVQAQAEQARAAYSAAQELLANANIRTPRDGTVYSLPVKPGQVLNVGDAVVRVADLSQMQVRAFVDEPEIGKLSVGQKINLTWDAIPGRNWTGSITRVPSSVTMVGTRTVGEIVCAVGNDDQKLLPNVNVNVVITTALHENALAVPREAVSLEPDGKHYIFLIQDGRLKKTIVQTGIANLTQIEITQGAAEGRQVATGATNSQPLTDGARVKVVQQ
jgi:HlyD family secretion protein